MIRGKKILGALLAFTLCFSMVIPAQADDISDAKKKQQELEQQKNTAEAEKSELSSELDSIVSKMEKTQSDLTAKETEINDAETELVTAKANEDDQYQTMKLRIKYMYENGSNEFLEILMEANSIADLLKKAEYINKISKCDRELLVEYEDTRKDVENRENALKKEYAELESLQLLDGLVPQMWEYKDDTVDKIDGIVHPKPPVAPTVKPNEGGAVTPPAPKKVIKNVYRQAAFPSKTLESQEDIDAYVERMRAYLTATMKDCDGIKLS